MKLALGTAQFGSDYGIKNNTGSILKNSSFQIIDSLKKYNIDTIDTAISYPGSEKILGMSDLSSFKIVTKLPFIQSRHNGVKDKIIKYIDRSLADLNLNSLYAVLLHFPEQALDKNGPEIISTLKDLKDKGVIQKIGISIYSPEIIEPILKEFTFDLIQAPMNLFDNRFVESGWLKRLKELNIEIHVRSIFLQGLLLMNKKNIPAKFSKWMYLFDEWNAWNLKNNINPYLACLQHVLSHNEVDKVIVGIDNLNQLDELVKSYSADFNIKIPSFSVQDEGLINPALWSNL